MLIADIKGSKKHSVQWDTAENPKGPSIAFCGIPFLVLDTLRLECHFGRDRSRARKDRRIKLVCTVDEMTPKDFTC